MNDLQLQVHELNQLILSGDTLKAMNTFYSDDVIMQENEESPRFGKEICLKQEMQNLKRISDLKSRLLNQAINPHTEVVFTEWEIVFRTLKGNRLKLVQVSIQQWRDNKIIKEKFYYKNIQRL